MALGWSSPLPASSRSQGEAAAVLALAGQAPTGCGAAPSWQGCSGEMALCALVLYFHGEFVSFLNQSTEVALAVALFPLCPLTGMCSSRGNSVSRG